MRERSLRWFVGGLLTTGGAGLLGLTSMMNAAFAFGDNDGVALILSGSGPLAGQTTTGPSASFVSEIFNRFVDPTTPFSPFSNQLTFPDYTAVGLNTDESDLTGFGTAVTDATSQLNTAITQTYAGDDIAVVSYSQSATAATQEMIALDALYAADPNTAPNPADLSFVLLGDPNNPDGGALERFSALNPGVADYNATPADTPYPTEIVTIQYDGEADFPQYPTDGLSDLNALMGYIEPHLDYDALTQAQLASAVELPTSPGYTGDTTYFEIPTQNLPLLDPLRDIPGVGNPLADLMQPDLRVLVDLGYGNGYANVATPFSLSVPPIDYNNVVSDLSLGAQQGMTAFMVDLGLSQSALPDAYPYLPYVPGGSVTDPDLFSTTITSSATSNPLTALSTELSSLFPSGFNVNDLGTLLPDLSNGFGTTGSDLAGMLGSDLAGLGLDPSDLTSVLDTFTSF